MECSQPFKRTAQEEQAAKNHEHFLTVRIYKTKITQNPNINQDSRANRPQNTNRSIA
jgi:hypothetical protein